MFHLLFNTQPREMNTDVMIDHGAGGWKWRLELLGCIWKGFGFFPFFLDDNILFVNGLFIRAMCSLKGL